MLVSCSEPGPEKVLEGYLASPWGGECPVSGCIYKLRLDANWAEMKQRVS